MVVRFMIGVDFNAEKMLPLEIWCEIAKKLKPIDLNHFIRVAQMMKYAGSFPDIVKSTCDDLYERLCVLDLTLPRKLQGSNVVTEYKVAFEKVKRKLEAEIKMLKEYQPKYAFPSMPDNLTPLQQLEFMDKMLSWLNYITFTVCVNKNNVFESKELRIEAQQYTRFPIEWLLGNPICKRMLEHVEVLIIEENPMTTVEVRHLPNLRDLHIYNKNLSCMLLDDLPMIRTLITTTDLAEILDLSSTKIDIEYVQNLGHGYIHINLIKLNQPQIFKTADLKSVESSIHHITENPDELMDQLEQDENDVLDWSDSNEESANQRSDMPETEIESILDERSMLLPYYAESATTPRGSKSPDNFEDPNSEAKNRIRP
jgi:hypothetical protein